MHHRNRFRKSTAAVLAVAQCATPAFAAVAGAWEVKDGQWMYMGEDGKYLSDAWLRDPSDGHLYHLDASGVTDSGWKLIDGIWYFLTNEHNGSFGAAIENAWAWVDGYCYYFGADGKMAAACTTPDGFTVNEDGQWTENGVAVYVPGRGYQTKPTPGGSTQMSTAKTSGGGGGRGGSSSGGNGGSGGGSHGGGSGTSSGNQDPDSGTGNPGEKPEDGTGTPDETHRETLYAYTVRYTDTEGNLLASYERKALKDSVITADAKEFAGYRKRDAGQSVFHLTMDQAVFAVVYEKDAGTGQGSQEEQVSYSYRIRYVDEEGFVFSETVGSGRPGGEIWIPQKAFDGYARKPGAGSPLKQ